MKLKILDVVKNVGIMIIISKNYNSLKKCYCDDSKYIMLILSIFFLHNPGNGIPTQYCIYTVYLSYCFSDTFLLRITFKLLNWYWNMFV